MNNFADSVKRKHIVKVSSFAHLPYFTCCFKFLPETVFWYGIWALMVTLPGSFGGGILWHTYGYAIALRTTTLYHHLWMPTARETDDWVDERKMITSATGKNREKEFLLGSALNFVCKTDRILIVNSTCSDTHLMRHKWSDLINYIQNYIRCMPCVLDLTFREWEMKHFLLSYIFYTFENQ